MKIFVLSGLVLICLTILIVYHTHKATPVMQTQEYTEKEKNIAWCKKLGGSIVLDSDMMRCIVR